MMNQCLLKLGLHVLLGVALATGCSKSDSTSADKSTSAKTSEPTPAGAGELIAKLHWIGKRQLALESNATNFMSIWSKPESAKLEAQTLDKLATAPWRLLKTPTPVAQAPSALLRPILDDLVQAESYLEVYGGTNQPGELVFAIRLDATRAALWQTNLAAVLESLVGHRGTTTPTPEPTFNIQHSTFNIELTRFGDWTVLSISKQQGGDAKLRLLTDFKSRIQLNNAPFAARSTNYWFETEFNAPRLSDSLQLGWKLPASFPELSLALAGDGQNVRARGELNFSEPLPALDSWQVPLHLTAEPLIGLAAARSVRPVLERLGVLKPGQLPQFPEQLLLWLRSGPPLQIYYAFPSDDATNTFRKLGFPIMDWVNSHADARRFGSISVDTNASELRWTGLQLCAPFLKVGSDPASPYLHGGFGLMPPGRTRLPTELQDRVVNTTNLIYFEWDFTGQTLPQWRYLDDVARMIFDEAHASRLRASRNSIEWIITNTTNLSHSVTELRQTQPHRIEFSRKSTLGFNAFELDILINWIEMPEFPKGMSSLWRTNPVPFVPFRLTNSPAANRP